MIYSDLIKYIIVVITKTLLMRYIFFFKGEHEHIISTGQYKNYQSFANLQLKTFKDFFS